MVGLCFVLEFFWGGVFGEGGWMRKEGGKGGGRWYVYQNMSMLDGRTVHAPVADEEDGVCHGGAPVSQLVMLCMQIVGFCLIFF